jgi:TonB-linked SusC/RagA family outer membrane protein
MRKIFLVLSAMFCLLINVLAQNRTITGKVTDEAGQGVPKASLLVKGTRIGTATATDGSFTLNIPSSAKTLMISGIGFTSKEIAIGNQADITVSLTADDKSLEEVVVVAYGTVKKEALTGSVGTVKAAQIEKRPIGNITRAIEGAIPGVVTTTGSGQPGNGLSIRVRGFGSINATSEPLFVVDGIPYSGSTSNINPSDVENITVLKDAAATALYGSRAANGVVIITTKRGQKGRNNISVRVMQGIATRGLQEYERLDAFQYYPIMWESYRNSLVYPASGTPIPIDTANRLASGLYPRFTTGTNAGRQNYRGTAYSDISQLLSYNPFNVPRDAIVGVDGKLNPAAQLLYPDDLDWTKDLLRNGSRKDYSVNFNGGSEKSDYYLSLGYVKENGYTVKTDLERYNARLNVNVQPKTWLKTGLSISGNHTVSNTVTDDGNFFVNPFFFSRNIGPIYPVYAHNMTTGAYVLDPLTNERVFDLGNLGSSPVGIANGIQNRPGGGLGGRHTLAEALLNDIKLRRTGVGAVSATDIMFLKKFKFTNTIGIGFENQQDNSYENQVVGDGAPAGRSRVETSSLSNVVLTQLLNYTNQFGDHRIDALVAHESQQLKQYSLDGFKQGQTFAGITDLGNFTTINSTNSTTNKRTIESYFSRVNYDYKGKYLLSGSIRTDANSQFSPQSRNGTFFSVGAGWNINKETFIENIGWFNILKLKTSYGEVGNADGIGFYAYQGLYNFQNNANEPGIIQSQTQTVPNNSLTWETNKQFDVSLDFGLFKNRVSGSIGYYNRVSEDLLFAVPQPLSSGTLSFNQNTATMYNRGIEAQLSTDIVRTKDFIANLNINLSTVKNKITKMPPLFPEIISGTKKLSVGHSIFDYYLRTYYGVDPADGAALYLAESTLPSATRRLITNKSGTVDTVTTSQSNGKFEYQGTAIPDLYGSVTPSITFKEITLSALFTFQIGGKTYDANYQSLMSSGNFGGALHTDILKRWQNPGDITDVPREDNGRTTDFGATSSRWLVDASYLNIRTLGITYNISKALASKFRVANGQFFVSAENIAFFSKRKGLNNQQAFSGVTSNSYPPARVVTVGVSLNL